MGLSYEDIVERIRTERGLGEEEINGRVREKLNKLSGLISKEGAAHIVANELGINLVEYIKKNGIKISRMMPGMRGVGVLGKVLRVYGVREYKKGERAGKIGNFLIGDGTGVMRVVMWDTNHIEMMDAISEGSIVRIRDAVVKENLGYKELHLGSYSEIVVNPEGATVEVNGNGYGNFDFSKRKIGDLTGGEFNVGIFGTVVQVFEIRFYDACSECMRKLNDGRCAEHGATGVRSVPVLNLIADDGSGNIRVVAFGDQVESMLKLEKGKVEMVKDNLGMFEEYRDKLTGAQVLLVGKVNKNEMFDRLEFVVSRVESFNLNEMVKEMAGEVLGG